jgi:hypothetical protein
MVTQEEAKLIAEYERLREKLFQIEALATAIDHRLVEIEKQLPDDYAAPERHEKRRESGEVKKYNSPGNP